MTPISLKGGWRGSRRGGGGGGQSQAEGAAQGIWVLEQGAQHAQEHPRQDQRLAEGALEEVQPRAAGGESLAADGEARICSVGGSIGLGGGGFCGQ